MKKLARNKSIKPNFSIGIDEVGRGPIAGPVAVGAFVILDESVKKVFKKVKESKQLSEKKREEWFAVIEEQKKNGKIDFAVTFQSEKIIDKKGLSFAIKNALNKSLNKVVEGSFKSLSGSNIVLDTDRVEVLLDGGLKAPTNYKNQKTIIKGDEKVMVIALASICAKVLRDRYMNKFVNKYPEYGFERHKGYGTAKHYDAIRKFGLLDIHRRSFMKGYTNKKGERM